MFLFKKWRRKQIAGKFFPVEWLRIIEKNVPYYKKLPADDRGELQRHILIFIREKTFEGCGGLEITDEIKVTIAAQACLLLLHRQTDYYPGLCSILVYPEAYVARYAQYLGAGVIIEGHHVRLGESWHRGTVVLSWDDIEKSTADICDGRNVIFHEFAHQLDISGARGDSTEVLSSRSSFITWARILQKEYQKLQQDTKNEKETFLDKYGATNPAEFFAVATESFFERPRQMQQQHPHLYNELKRFYNQDPAKL